MKCDLFMSVDGKSQKVGFYIFVDFEPQVGDILRQVTVFGKETDVMVSERDWRDGKMELWVREDYKVVTGYRH